MKDLPKVHQNIANLIRVPGHKLRTLAFKYDAMPQKKKTKHNLIAALLEKISYDELIKDPIICEHTRFWQTRTHRVNLLKERSKL